MKTNSKKAVRYEYLVIGAGPAGLQLAYFLQKTRRRYLVLESGNSAGTFFRHFPRHRKLISINKLHTGYDDPEINLRWDWNSLLSDDDHFLFKDYSKEYFPDAGDLVRYLSDFAERFNLDIKYGTKVVRVSKDAGFRALDSEGNSYLCQRLIIATGVHQPYIPPIPGVELADKYVDVSIDPEEFTNQRVLIIGKGNSAFETADNLIGSTAIIHLASPTPVSLAWKTHFVGHLRAVNNNLLDTYQLKSQNAALDARIEKIERKDGKLIASISYTHANGHKAKISYDRVILCAGFQFDGSIFDETCKPELTINDRFPKQTSAWESTNVKGLYFAGCLTMVRDYRRTASGFIHGFRYNIRALYRILERKYHGKEWPCSVIDATPEALMMTILKRVNRNSALWQQFGFLCDLIIISEKDGVARYYEETPKDFVRDSEFGRNEHYYTVTLEFGDHDGDPLAVIRDHHPSQAHRSVFLHPILRHYEGVNLVSELHLLEEVLNEWWDPEIHLEPLLAFFKRELGKGSETTQKPTPNLKANESTVLKWAGP